MEDIGAGNTPRFYARCPTAPPLPTLVHTVDIDVSVLPFLKCKMERRSPHCGVVNVNSLTFGKNSAATGMSATEKLIRKLIILFSVLCLNSIQ